ncbi:hypothetical protein QPK87_25220 [Kamptonema cortianum]|nr:hypothetical protein [Desertifilum sp.]MDK3159836.1 hypothetical protein [Kamptonema cortianum]
METNDRSINPEDLEKELADVRAESRKADPEVTGSNSKRPTKKPKRQDESAIATRTSDQIASATSQSAQDMVEVEQQAKKTRIAGGMTKGIKDAQDVRRGYQLGLMEGVTQGMAEDTAQFIQGIVGGLTEHAEDTVDVDDLLESVRSKKNPLEALDLRPDTSATQTNRFSIFD